MSERPMGEETVVDENDPNLMWYVRCDEGGYYAARFRPNAHETFDTAPPRFRSYAEAARVARWAHENVAAQERNLPPRECAESEMREVEDRLDDESYASGKLFEQKASEDDLRFLAGYVRAVTRGLTPSEADVVRLDAMARNGGE